MLIFMIHSKEIQTEALWQKEACAIIIAVFTRFAANHNKLVIYDKEDIKVKFSKRILNVAPSATVSI